MDGKITGVDRPTTGLINNTCFFTVPTHVEPNVERTTPPNPICCRVEVEDVDSDDEDDDETNESSQAPQVEVHNDHAEEEEEAEASQLGRGSRVRNPTNFYQSDFSNIRYNYLDELTSYSCALKEQGIEQRES